MKTHLYLIQSPLQALNAFEARRVSRGTEQGRHVLVVFDRAEEANNRMVANTLRCLGWSPDLVLPYPVSRLGKVRVWLRLKRFLQTLGSVQRVCIGAFDSGLMMAAANRCHGTESVLLDDGTASLIFPAYRYENARSKHQKLGQAIPLLGFNTHLPDALVCFSIYDLPLKSPDRLERNHLGFLRQSVRYADDGPVFFLGSVFPDVGIVSFERFFEWMASVRSWFGTRPIYYFPHRRELIDLKKDALARLNMQIMQPELPFELYLATAPEAPSCVAGFYSTVFDTLRVAGLAEPGRMVVFRVPEDCIADPLERRMAHACHESYEAAGMKVVRGFEVGEPSTKP
jgi:hypothetical protein